MLLLCIPSQLLIHGSLSLGWEVLGTPREGDAPAPHPFATAGPWEAAAERATHRSLSYSTSSC